MKYRLVCRVSDGHSYWIDGSGEVFVADDSMQREGDPTSTDDGGLRVRDPINVVSTPTGCYIRVPVKLDRDGRRSTVTERFTLCNLRWMRQRLEPHGIRFDLDNLREALA